MLPEGLADEFGVPENQRPGSLTASHVRGPRLRGLYYIRASWAGRTSDQAGPMWGTPFYALGRIKTEILKQAVGARGGGTGTGDQEYVSPRNSGFSKVLGPSGPLTRT